MKKTPYTKIVAVNSDEGSVEIKFKPQGSDVDADPITLHISPHKDYVFMTISHSLISRIEQGANLLRAFFNIDK